MAGPKDECSPRGERAGRKRRVTPTSQFSGSALMIDRHCDEDPLTQAVVAAGDSRISERMGKISLAIVHDVEQFRRSSNNATS